MDLELELRRARRSKRICTFLGGVAVVLWWFVAFSAVAQSLGIQPEGYAPGMIGEPDVLRSYQTSNEPFLLDDANTVMHCIDGRDFDGSTLRCGKTAVRHRSVGPFSAANYFTGTTDSPINTLTMWMGCFIVQPTTAGAGVILHSSTANTGFDVGINAGQQAYVTCYDGAGAHTDTTAGTAAVNQQHIICAGSDGFACYVRLDLGGVGGVGAAATAPGAHAPIIGTDGVTPFTGTIAEAWLTSTAWNGAGAVETAVMATTLPSPALPGLSGANGVAGDANTRLHCVGDDYSGVRWNCNPDRNKHTAIGSFSDTAEAPYGFLSMGLNSVLNLPAVGWSSCMTFDRAGGGTSISTILSNLNATGWAAYYDSTGATCVFNGFAVTTAEVPIVGTNVLCCGADATQQYAQLNGGVVAVGGLGYTPDATATGFLGKYETAGGVQSRGTISEFWASTTPWVDATIASYQSAALTATGAGAALATAAADPNTVLFTTFDEWNGTSVKSGTGPNWVTNGSIKRTRTNRNWPATNFGVNGFVASIDAPFNWPSVAWAMQGAVPAARSSAGFPTGFGPDRRQLGSFSVANYLNMGAGADVLDFTSSFTGVVIFDTSTTNTEALISDGNAVNAGWRLQVNGGAAALWVMDGLAAGVKTIPSTAFATTGTHIVGFGWNSGTNLKLKIDASAVQTQANANAYAAGAANAALIGRDIAAGLVGTNKRIHEIYFTTTPPSDDFLNQLNAAAQRCNTPGACIPEDGNTVMHCTVDTDWSVSGASGLRCSKNLGNQPWTTTGAPVVTSAPYAWAYGTTGVDREAAGVFTDVNYFTGPVTTPLDFNVNGWEACAVFKYDTIPTTNPFILFNATGATDGWDMEVLNAGTFQCRVHNAGIGTATTANAAVTNGLNIGCCGYDGANVKAKLNGGVTATAARAYVVPGAATPLLGRGTAAGNAFTTGRVHEFWATNTPFTEADIANRQARFMNLIAGSYGEVETFTRATTSSTTDPDGNISYVPANMPVNERNGLLGFSQRRNDALQSEAFDQNPPWVPTNLACAPNTTAAPDGQVTADTCTDNANNTAHEVVQAYVATAAAWTVSVFARAGTLGFVHLSADNANFTWFNLATCAPATNAAGNTAATYLSVPVAGVSYCRVAVTRTMGAGAANASIGVSAADATRVYIGAGGTAMLWGGQIEAGPYMGPYIPTAALAVQRNADAPSFVNPLTGNTDWCVELDYTPYLGRSWAVNPNNYVWALGSFGAANSAYGFISSIRVYLRVYDSGGVLKEFSAPQAFAAASTHKLRWCSLGGALRIEFDGAVQAGTVVGVGTGVLSSMPTALALNPVSMDGYVKNIVVDPPLLASSEVTLRQPLNLNNPVDLTQAGIPAPSLDCRGSQYTGGATWPCTGGTGNKVGGATSGNGSPYYPSGFGGTRETSAFFNSATPDYFDFGDTFDQTGDFSVCAVFRTETIGATVGTIISKFDAAAGTTQFLFYRSAAALNAIVAKADGTQTVHAVGTLAANEWNVACFAYDFVADGSSILRSSLNGVAPAETANAVGPPINVAAALRIGYRASNTQPWSGYIARTMLWTGRAFSAAELARIVSLLQTGVASPITNTRTNTSTVTPVPTAAVPSLFNASARTPRVEISGVLSEQAKTNYCKDSENLATANWTSSAGIAYVANQGTFPDGNATMDQITSTLNTDTTAQTAVMSTNPTFSVSGWARSIAGSVVESIIGACPGGNNVTTCTCGTNTGLACTAASLNNECWAYATFTTTPVRIWANFTCTATTTSPVISVHDGQYRTTGAVGGMFGGLQIEYGLYPTSYVPTPNGVAVSRQGDANLQTNVLRDSQNRWCMRVVATPENGRSWNGTYMILHLGGGLAQPNTALLQTANTNMYGYVYDATGTVKTLTWAHGYAAGSAHTLAFCSNNGTLKLYSDGVDTGAAVGGIGTGIITTMPSQFYIGNVGGTYQFDGNLQYADQCPNADPTRCW